MSFKRQSLYYIGVGLVQFLVDWGVMVLLSNAGMQVGLANIAGRVAGAVLGFVLNGLLTFNGEHHHMGRKQLVRFVIMWCITTAGSTVAIHWLDAEFGLRIAQWLKPVVELLCGVVGFLLSRYWVYRK